ncbi:MAG: DUF1266 domain-containing protein [Lachnospiraceae bacterium]|nr:DUF1266 domain-containing protein [Lachnospiraceae bacterium]
MSANRYHISNKNIYGFKTNMFQMFLVIPVLIALALLAEFVLGPVLYRFYQQDVTVEKGAAGSEAGAEVQVAESLADMERLETFTLITKGAVINYDTVRSGDQIYHRLRLPSGELVIAHINKKAIQDTDEPGLYRLPTGVWREWEPPAEILVYQELLAATDHYVDMYGDYVPVLSQADYGTALGRIASVWLFIIAVFLYRVIGVRRWRFAPAVFWRRDPLLPKDDTELWCASTFAIWAHSFPMLEGWPLVTGVHGSRKVVANFRRTALGEQWDIYDRQGGLQTVHELTEKHAGCFDTPCAGWDLCRATQLLGMMYLVKMIDREELDAEFVRAGRVIQQRFHSWDEMAESYLEGYEAWLERIGQQNAAQYAARRRAIFQQLKANPDGPYSVPWKTNLTSIPGSGERTVLKKVLFRYRDPKL